jgi:hypothetical protein
MPDVEEQAVVRKSRTRLRFGLKTLLIAMTVVCLLLGYWFARVRRAEEMIARHDRLWNTVINNIVTPPTDVTYHSFIGTENDIKDRFSWGGHLNPKGVVMGTGSMGTVRSESFTVDFSKFQPPASRKNIAGVLIDHYSSGLGAAGVSRCYDGGSSNLQRRAVWTSPREDLAVVIDVSASRDEPYAEVQILLIDSQQLFIW